MPKKNENNPDSIFPLLRIPALCKHAQMWAEQYDFVKKITLYEAPNHLLKTLTAVKYIVAFDLPETGGKELGLRIRTFKQFFYIFDGLPEVNESFYREIHKEQFTQKHREEWLFTTETPEGVLAEYSQVLYPKPLPKSKQVEDLAASNSKNKEPENVFRKEGPAWRIHYEGASLSGLKGKGFDLFYYLVVNKRKVFHTEELSQEIDNTRINRGIDISYLEHGHSQLDNNYSKKGKKTADVNAKIYGESLEKLKKDRLYLQDELKKAKSDNDPGRIEKCEQELLEFNKYCSSLLDSRGQSRDEINQVITNKNRICKRMERALNELKKHDEKTYLHFKNSLSPINSFFQSYNPDRPINWLT